jgi:CDP-paratose 2-epimerase
MQSGHDVTVFDDLSRPGSERNLDWLRQQGGFDFIRGDICDDRLLDKTVRATRFDAIIHLAGQVAVTTSVVDPRRDFEINAVGTFNLLEAVRRFSGDTIVVHASTNKVYGKLPDVVIAEQELRYILPGLPHGISEKQRLDFHSPYGCSKGAADQYVCDYARIYGLRTVNLRQSCIYGRRQFGVEDQGWVAWFTIAQHFHRPVTIYGTGKQVRDILFVDDLVECYLAAIERIDQVAGMTFNVGGGPESTLSLLELLNTLEKLSGREVVRTFDEWRPGDQPVYVSDIRRANESLGWRPLVSAETGLAILHSWVAENEDCFAHFAPSVAV